MSVGTATILASGRLGKGMQTPVEAARRRAAQQHGVIGRGQAVAASLTPSAIGRLVKAGSWRIELPGVYAMAGAPNSREQRFMAAALWAGEGAAVSHRAAAALWRLDGLPDTPLPEITSPRRLTSPEVLTHRGQLTRREVTRLGAITVTDPARTLLDLGSVVPVLVVRTALDDALRRGLTTAARLQRRLRDHGNHGRSGWGVLRRLIIEEPVAESVLERRLLRVLREARLPRPVTQHPIREGRRIIARLDFAYPEARLAIEAEGWRYHGGPEAFHRDLARRNRLTRAGWTVLHATWADLEDPQTLLEAIRGGLGPGLKRSRRAV